VAHRSAHVGKTAALLIAAGLIAFFGVSLAWGTGMTLTTVAAGYLLLLVAVARATRKPRHGTVFAAAACVVGVASALLVPLTWGASLFLAAFALPLALPAVVVPGRGRWVGFLALLINTTLAVVLALVWFGLGSDLGGPWN
jgi:hypothetical protein